MWMYFFFCVVYSHLQVAGPGMKARQGQYPLLWPARQNTLRSSHSNMVNCLVLMAAVTGRVVYHPPFMQTVSCSYMEGGYAVQRLDCMLMWYLFHYSAGDCWGCQCHCTEERRSLALTSQERTCWLWWNVSLPQVYADVSIFCSFHFILFYFICSAISSISSH